MSGTRCRLHAVPSMLLLLFCFLEGITNSLSLSHHLSSASRLRDARRIVDSKDSPASKDLIDVDTSKVPLSPGFLPSVPYPGEVGMFLDAFRPPESFRERNPLSASKYSRKKRGAYLRDFSDEEEEEGEDGGTSGRDMNHPSNTLQQLESRHMELYQPDAATIQEMSFNGAGYLRGGVEGNAPNPRIPKGYASPAPENRRAAQDFQAAFHPERGRSRVAGPSVDTDHDTRPTGRRPAVVSVPEFDDSEGLGKHDDLQSPGHADVFTAFPRQYSDVTGMNSFFYKDPFTGLLKAVDGSPGTDDKESLLKNHRLQPAASEEKRIVITRSGVRINSTGKFEKAEPGKKMKTPKEQSRRKRSISHDKTSDDNTASGSSNVPLETSVETRNSAHYSVSDEQQDSAGSGFIPLTGTFNGGTIHFTLPYYGSNGPVSSSYSSGPPVGGYNSYGSSRHYGNPAPDYYPHSEARRYSYGMLGSGNFEVIRGGLFPENRPTHVVGGYDGGRNSYAPEVYNSYGGTTEIIIDGPIQGFQGFDNFPAHLINALSKRSELVVGKPDVL